MNSRQFTSTSTFSSDFYTPVRRNGNAQGTCSLQETEVPVGRSDLKFDRLQASNIASISVAGSSSMISLTRMPGLGWSRYSHRSSFARYGSRAVLARLEGPKLRRREQTISIPDRTDPIAAMSVHN